MSELPKCRLCGRSLILLAEDQGGIWFHPTSETLRDPCPLDTVHFTAAEWAKLMGGGEPVAWISVVQCIGPDYGKERYGKLPIQSLNPAYYKHVPLYTHAAPAVDDAVIRDAVRYRWLRDNNHLGARFSAGNSHMSYEDNIDTDIDDAMKGEC